MGDIMHNFPQQTLLEINDEILRFECLEAGLGQPSGSLNHVLAHPDPQQTFHHFHFAALFTFY